MAQRLIFKEDEPILRKTCREVVKFDKELAQLIDDMHETLDLSKGVGLAANQVGIRRQIFVLHNADKRLEFVNPKIIKTKGETIDVEGCLSCPNQTGKVKRPQEIEVIAQDRTGKNFSIKLENLDARIVCHETDHLVGRLFKDIAFDLKFE